MRKVLRAVILLPSVLLSLFVLFLDTITSIIWSDFFQSNWEAAFSDQFKVVLFLVILLIGVIVVFVLTTMQTIYYFIRSNKDSLKAGLILLLLILFIPLIGMIIARVISDQDPILVALKCSFEKENIDLVRITQWLNELNGEIAPLCSLKYLEKSKVPADIQKMLSPHFENIQLKSDINGKTILEITYSSLSVFVDVVIGSSPTNYNFHQNQPRYIVISEKSFIWIDM